MALAKASNARRIVSSEWVEKLQRVISIANERSANINKRKLCKFRGLCHKYLLIFEIEIQEVIWEPKMLKSLKEKPDSNLFFGTEPLMLGKLVQLPIRMIMSISMLAASSRTREKVHTPYQSTTNGMEYGSRSFRNFMGCRARLMRNATSKVMSTRFGISSYTASPRSS